MNDKRVDDAGERCRFPQLDLAAVGSQEPQGGRGAALMYLHGMSTGDFAPALAAFFGSAAGLSASVITRLTPSGRPNSVPSLSERLDDRDFVYVWATGCTSTCACKRTGLRPGHRGCPGRRRHQGAGGHRRWLPGVHRVLGRPAAGPQAPGACEPRCSPSATAPSGGERWGVPRDRGPAVLGAQGRQRPQRPAQVGPAHGPPHAGRDPRRRRPHPRPDRRWTPSPTSSAPSGPRRWPRSSTTSSPCSPSMTSRPSTGCT